jgi:hypothetical protein
MKDIGEMLGVTQQSVAYRALVRGLPPRGQACTVYRYKKITSPEFSAMWLAGVGRTEMAAHFGCCGKSVGNEAKRRGLPERSINWRSAITVAQFRVLQAAAETQAALVAAEMVDHRHGGRRAA